MAFTVAEPDFELSPHTGMTRRHWVEAGKFLLEGVLKHVESFEDPITVPKQPGKSYPQEDDPAWRFRSAEFEGLSRTFMIAAPVIAADPDAGVAGYNLRDYYASLILRSTDPKHPNFVGTITEMQRQYGQPLFQHTAEGAALVLGLMMSRAEIWDRYSQAEKDQVAAVLSDYAHNRTNSHNWRWFNVIMGSFLKLNGYKVDMERVRDHLQNLLAFYAGDGWYRDMGQFDYYSCWAFQFYGPIWCSLYGYEREPEIAATIERWHNELQKTYPLMFSRRGHSLMWGRSIIYRCAASAPLAVAYRLKNPVVDAGWARRIASGNLLQFISRDDTFVEGVPSLGFYRTFEPLVQSYSCAISPFWLAKVFLALDLPADSPFWTARENEGRWEQLGEDQATIVLDGPGVQITIHGKAGTAEVRPGKVQRNSSNPNYTRLAYNTDFLWENDSPEGHTAGTYCIQQLGTDLDFMANRNLRYAGQAGGVLYRQTDLPGWQARIDLAEIPLPGGVLRLDRLSMPYAYELHLGHLALAHLDGQEPTVRSYEKDGRTIITAACGLRRVAMVAYHGWDGLDSATHEGLNAEADRSTVCYAHRRRQKDYSGMELVVTLLLHGADPDPWTDEELDPVEQMEIMPHAPSGQPCGARLALKDRRSFTIDFENLMGRVQT